MGIIRVLHEKVVSQIAAGEIIERPASVVRELLDNSIDAGSRRIFILLERGGKARIRVSDDGSGMQRDDLLLCIERHATSKISSVSELFSIRSLGFRGEALPSIGAVSRMEITTRPHDLLAGHRLKVAGGSLRSIEEIGCPAGTVVDVRDLFFNLPARKKFLKGERTECDQVTEVVTRLGLPYLKVHFRLDEGDRTLINLPVSTEMNHRLSAIFGREVAVCMQEESLETRDFRLRLYLGDPDHARSKADRILFYVNQRSIRDRLLMHAVMEGYGQRLMRGRYPQAVVFLDVEPSLVDVNVHPAKLEVRLQQGRDIHPVLIETVQRRFGRKIYPVSDSHPEMSVDSVGRSSSQMAFEPPAQYEPQGGENQKAAGWSAEDFRILGQVGETYIVFETRQGFVLMDQHAAHERILYEGLRNSYRASKLETQCFLIPPRLELSLKDAGVVMGSLSQLRDLGLEVEPFGGTTFLLRSVPSLLLNTRWDRLFPDLIPALEGSGSIDKGDVDNDFLKILACHGAIKAGDRLTVDEMTHLVRELSGTSLPTNCPHGRPTLRRYSFEELEKSFRRTG